MRTDVAKGRDGRSVRRSDSAPRMQAPGWQVVLALSAITLVGAWLRARHLGWASLWWDEVVHLQTARLPLGELLRHVREGIPPGAGSAGAMPLDYVVLHAWLALAPDPAPVDLVAWVRLPAFFWSTLAVPVMWWALRRGFGDGAALAAALALALSVPGALYAAEVRFYGLLIFTSTWSLGAAARASAVPEDGRAWLGWIVAALLLAATAATGLLLAATEFAVLVAFAALPYARRFRRGRPLAWSAGAGLGLAALAWLWLREIDPWWSYGRPQAQAITVGAVVGETFDFFTGRELGAMVLLLGGLAVVVHRAWRGDGAARALAVTLLASLLLLPVLAALIRVKGYYFHPRHALFLLPVAAAMVGAAADAAADVAARFVRSAAAPLGAGAAWSQRPRRGLALPLALAVVATVGLPAARAFVAEPAPFLARTKPLRQLEGLHAPLAQAVAALAPDACLVLVADRDSPANAVLALHLRWWGLDGRVLLRSSTLAAPELSRRLERGPTLPPALYMRPAVGLFPEFRRLLGFPPRPESAICPVPALALLAWTSGLSGIDARHWRIQQGVGFALGMARAAGGEPATARPRAKIPHGSR